jgi:hypothetical protein
MTQGIDAGRVLQNRSWSAFVARNRGTKTRRAFLVARLPFAPTLRQINFALLAATGPVIHVLFDHILALVSQLGKA